ncbi:hypothetical protein [Streptomyces sp. NPDC047009]|uniref:hypothetical protein n=1 Tax=Streptomyces sp. NPDC047009 TaxID=3154496 RepID=UPI0033F5F792
MNKFMRRIATAAASLAVAGGALLAVSTSASAAPLPADAPLPARAGVVADAGTTGENDSGNGDSSVGYSRCDRFYPWIWEQLMTFGYDPYPGPQHSANESSDAR